MVTRSASRARTSFGRSLIVSRSKTPLRYIHVASWRPRYRDAPSSTARSSSSFGRKPTRFTDSPRLRLRLAPPHSQTRLASGCGSHPHIHRLASPPAAARPPPIPHPPPPPPRLPPPPSPNPPPPPRRPPPPPSRTPPEDHTHAP